ncbi:uncharacterized protein KY384_004776 [Bacidia gigantensis]|uniref:uncharacterized protein n=1 Tax=Bacidia gigantensis TaxID=2732470 RepID=UPI001D0501D9|nr:uncharacterized protein KY384_004776 [Bacidia gigantensis]KAG8530275.1 hypothetical protein KY384_004776 [Bacidia gigantensis]
MSQHGKLRFSIVDLWNNVTNITNQNIPHDSRLTIASSGYASLTKDTCEALAGSGMSRYEGSAIWTRATTWKFPLFQVFALFPRPPLNLKTEIFVIVHLLGDPIDSVQNLLLKISRCQSKVRDWKTELERLNVDVDPHRGHGIDELAQRREEEQIRQCRWKSLALVTDAYDEWGEADHQIVVMKSLLDSSTDKASLLDTVRHTSDALAADRATKYLPAIIALASFVAIIGVAMARTAAAIGGPSFNTSLFISVEMHSITFSSLYFWILPALLFSSFIGVSQTEARIPRILDRFHDDLQKHFSQPTPHANLPDITRRVNELRVFTEPSTDHRMFHGGIYSWQPSIEQYCTLQSSNTAQRPQDTDTSRPTDPLLNDTPNVPSRGRQGNSQNGNPHQSRNVVTHTASSNRDTSHQTAQNNSSAQEPTHIVTTKVTSRIWNWLKCRFLPVLIVLIPTISGAVVSSRVPPDGWNCRVSGEVAIFFAWFISAELNLLIQYCIPLRNTTQKKLFRVTFSKDIFFTLGTIAWVFATLVGAMNRCDCWIDHDGSLILPQRKDIDRILQRRLNRDYPAWIFSGVAVELIVIPLWVKFSHGDALKVFVQRDDGRSNVEWFWDMRDWIRRHFMRTRIRTDSWFHLMRTTPRET